MEPLFWRQLLDWDECPLNGDVSLIELTDAKIICSGAVIQGTPSRPGKVSPEWRCPLNRGNCKMEPPFREHPQDQEKCPLNGDVPSIEGNGKCKRCKLKWNLHSRGDCKVQTSIQGTPSKLGEVVTNVA